MESSSKAGFGIDRPRRTEYGMVREDSLTATRGEEACAASSVFFGPQLLYCLTALRIAFSVNYATCKARLTVLSLTLPVPS